MLGSHLDEVTRKKIVNGEYMDFAKLMPKDQISLEEDNRMEMVSKGGMSYWVPLADRENSTISSFFKWEQAFRVFANVYTESYPGKAGELIQYNHVIQTATQTFSWDNVYRYDREFRIHMSKHHLTRSWAIILQQAWSMFLKDKVGQGGTPDGKANGFFTGGAQSNGVRKKLCFNFNSGHCEYRQRCKFEHHCSFCHKFGHGSWNCRRARKKRNNNGGYHNNNNGQPKQEPNGEGRTK